MRQDYDRQRTGNLGAPTSILRGGRATARQAEAQRGPTALQGLLSIAEPIFKQKFIDETERLYVEGQRARHLGTAYADISSNVFAKPFLRGGFQDQDYLIAQAEFSRKTAQYIADAGKKLDPEEFQKYMQQESAELFTRAGKGLSRQGRASMVTSQMAAEDTLTQQQANAHQDWVIEEAGKRFSTRATSIVASVNDARLNGTDATPLLQEALSLARDMDSTLPPALAVETKANFIKALYESDNYEEAEVLHNIALDTNLLDGAPLELLNELSKVRRATRDRNSIRRGHAYVSKYAEMTTAHNNGWVMQGPELTQALSFFEESTYSEKELMKFMVPKDSSSTAARRRSNAELYMNVDIAGQLRAGHSRQTYADDAWAELMQYVTDDNVGEVLVPMLDAAVKNGFIAKGAVDYIDASIDALMSSDDWSATPAQVQIVQSTIDFLQGLDTQQRENAVFDIVGKLPAEKQSYALAVLQDGSRTLQETFQNVAATFNEVASQKSDSPEARAAKAKMDAAALELLTPNYLQTGWTYITNKVGGAFGANLKEDSYAYNAYVMEVQKTAKRMLSDRTYILTPPQDVVKLAQRDVDSRVVKFHPQGGDAVAIIMPVNSQGQNVFMEGIYATTDANGAPLVANVGMDEVANAARELTPPEGKGIQVTYATEPNGNILVIQQDKRTGEPIQGTDVRILKPSDIAEEIARQRENNLLEVYKHEVGTTVPRRTTEGWDADVFINGQNPTGVDTAKVFEWRKGLLDAEGYSPVPYKDANGWSVGIGHWLGKEPPRERRYSSEEVERIFQADSAQAILDAERIAREYGIDTDNEDVVLAIADMVFQLGAGGAREFDETFRDIALRQNYAGIEQRALNDWKWSKQTPKRVDKFLQRIRGYFDE